MAIGIFLLNEGKENGKESFIFSRNFSISREGFAS